MEVIHMVVNNFIKIFLLPLIFITVPVFADVYGNGPYGSQVYSWPGTPSSNTPTPVVVTQSPGSSGGPGSVPASLLNTSNSTTTVKNNYSTTTVTSNPLVNTTPTLYTRNLDLNMLGDDVKSLQQFLNKSGFVVSTTGPGSIGNETNKFGPATRASLIKFQKANNILPAIGYFGPLTRTFINSSKNNNNIPTSTAPKPSVNTISTVYTRNLDLNMAGDDVKSLQQFLNKNGFIISQTGPGSLGNETNKFGPATKAALAKFQKANNILPAIGYFGPLTREFVNR